MHGGGNNRKICNSQGNSLINDIFKKLNLNLSIMHQFLPNKTLFIFLMLKMMDVKVNGCRYFTTYDIS